MKVNRYLFGAGFVAGKAVLDLGCATGYGTSLLKERGALRVVGADVSGEAVRVARGRYRRHGVEFLVLDAQRLPFHDGAFDTVIAFETIEHLPRYEDFVAECWRVLKPGGTLIASTPNKAVVSPDRERPYRCHHFHEFRAQELTALLTGWFSGVDLLGCIPFEKAGKVKDDMLYRLALVLTSLLSPRHLLAASKVVNLVTWLPFMRNLRLIRVEDTVDWGVFFNPKYQPYALNSGSPQPLGLIAIAQKG